MPSKYIKSLLPPNCMNATSNLAYVLYDDFFKRIFLFSKTTATSSVNRLASPREYKSDKQNLIADVFAAVFILTDIDNSTSVAINIWILLVSIQNRVMHKSLYRRHYSINYQPTLTLKTTSTNITISQCEHSAPMSWSTLASVQQSVGQKEP